MKLAASLAAAVMLTCPVVASATPPARSASVDAPGLTAGPFITRAGLVWEGPSGIMLSGAEGKTAVLAPTDAPNWDNFDDLAWFGGRWWVAARPSGVFAGRIGGALRALPQLRRCNAASPSATGTTATYAVSGEHLYAALSARCLKHGSGSRGAVVDVDLRTHHLRVLVRTSDTVEHLAASGKYLALALRAPPTPRTGPRTVEQSEPQVFVRVLDAATGALVNQVRKPSAQMRNTVSGLQVDVRGDVLVTAGCCGVSPGELAHVAQPPRIMAWWWAKAGAKVGREIQLGEDAVLSDGRVAFLSDGRSALFPFDSELIKITNLRAGTTSTVVEFVGSAAPAGLALSGDRLAWAQQSVVIDVVRSPAIYSCTPVTLAPVELRGLDLRDVRSSPLVSSGAPIPPQYAHEPECQEAAVP